LQAVANSKANTNLVKTKADANANSKDPNKYVTLMMISPPLIWCAGGRRTAIPTIDGYNNRYTRVYVGPSFA